MRDAYGIPVVDKSTSRADAASRSSHPEWRGRRRRRRRKDAGSFRAFREKTQKSPRRHDTISRRANPGRTPSVLFVFFCSRKTYSDRSSALRANVERPARTMVIEYYYALSRGGDGCRRRYAGDVPRILRQTEWPSGFARSAAQTRGLKVCRYFRLTSSRGPRFGVTYARRISAYRARIPGGLTVPRKTFPPAFWPTLPRTSDYRRSRFFRTRGGRSACRKRFVKITNLVVSVFRSETTPDREYCDTENDNIVARFSTIKTLPTPARTTSSTPVGRRV